MTKRTDQPDDILHEPPPVSEGTANINIRPKPREEAGTNAAIAATAAAGGIPGAIVAAGLKPGGGKKQR